MSIYLILYITIILFSIFIGIMFFKKYSNSGGEFFLLFTISLSIWFVSFFLSFFSTTNLDLLVYYGRIAYFTSIIGSYSLLMFVIVFTYNVKKYIKYKYLFYIFSIILFIIYIFTPYIISGVEYNIEKNDYYESFGYLFLLHTTLTSLFPILFLYLSVKKYKSLININKIRFKYILLGAFLFIILGVTFQLILPIYGIYLLEKEMVIFIIPFLLFSWYSISRYNFSSLRTGLGKIGIFIVSIFISILWIQIIKFYYLSFGNNFTSFWGFSEYIGIFDIILGISIFFVTYKIFTKELLGGIPGSLLLKKISQIEKQLSFIKTIIDLNEFLKLKFSKILKINYINIIVFKEYNNNLELYNYFIKDYSRDIFINDIVFLEENKNKFSLKLIREQLNIKSYLIFPLLNNKNKLIGIFEIGEKPFKEYFSLEEINIIKDFASFLTGHLKYIEIYSKINDLNINLDKKIDEKTIKYNELINKQNEFISVVSHELKTPLSTCIFQVDLLLDDINEGENSIEHIKREIGIVEQQLTKISDLTNSLFVNQRYDLGKIKLFKETINIKDFLLEEISIFINEYKEIKFDINLANNLGDLDIDKVQFSQVITNLINNAIKFASKKEKYIRLSSYIDKDLLYIIIEDNGIGFGDIDSSLIFEKYNTGKRTSVGIGMGLYLCDKIIGLHDGNIKAKNSKDLGGAKFVIKLKKNNN